MNMPSSSTTGVLLINLGTPDAPTVPAVRRYLNEFLSDPAVIDLPTLFRHLLLYCLILPFRPRRTARLYQKIWLPEGSPLRVYNDYLCQQLVQVLGTSFSVAVGMRYGNPSIKTAIDQLHERNCQQLIVLPLFPQYSKAATGSALKKTRAILTEKKYTFPIIAKPNFFDAPEYIYSLAKLIRETLNHDWPEYFVFSYHGLPMHHLPSDVCQTVNCNKKTACPPASLENRPCYRAQCFATTTLIVKALKLSSRDYSVSFQSRLGAIPWIQPYTNKTLIALRKRGIKKIALVCPSFVVDCLETLEEIGLRAKAQWQSLGGSSFQLVPALNAHPFWINALKQLITRISKSC